MGVSGHVELSQEALPERHGVGVPHRQRELVAAQPSDQITIGHHTAGPVGNCDEGRIPRTMTDGLVGRSEAVQVHEQHGELRLGGDAGELVQARPERGPAERAGQAVVSGVMAGRVTTERWRVRRRTPRRRCRPSPYDRMVSPATGITTRRR